MEDPGSNLLQIEGGGEYSIGTGRGRDGGVDLRDVGGDEEDRDVGPLGAGGRPVRPTAETPEELDGTEAAERGVQQDEVERTEAEDLQGLERTGDGAGPESGQEQPLSQKPGEIRVVTDDQQMGPVAGPSSSQTVPPQGGAVWFRAASDT